MAENLGKWPSKPGPVSKIRPPDGCGRDAVPLAMEWWYDFPEFGDYLGNVGLIFSDVPRKASTPCPAGPVRQAAGP